MNLRKLKSVYQDKCPKCNATNRRRCHLEVVISELEDFKTYKPITFCEECGKATVPHFFVFGHIYYELFWTVFNSIKNELQHSAYTTKELGSIILIYDDKIYPIPGGSVHKMRTHAEENKYKDHSPEIPFESYDALRKIAFKKLGGF